MRVLLLVAAFLASYACAQTECTALNGPVRCQTCPEGSAVNVMSDLPRISTSGQTVSANLGDYRWFNCSESGEEMCSMVDMDGLGFDAVTNNPTFPLPSDPQSVRTYAEGVAMYAVVAVLLGLLAIPCACFVCCLRCSCWGKCCCCCGCCRYGTCGGAYPTYRDHNDCCGFIELSKPSLALPESTAAPASSAPPAVGAAAKFHYHPIERWVIRGLMYVYVLFVLAMVAIGHLNGNEGLGAGAQRASARIGGGVADLAQGMVDPLSNTVIRLVGDTLTPGIFSFNETFHEYSSLARIADTLSVIAGEIDNIPDASAAQSFVDSTLDVINTTKVALNTTVDLLTNIEDFLDNDVTELRDNVTAVLDDMDSVLARQADVFSSLNSTMLQMEEAKNRLDNNTHGVTVVKQQVAAFNNRPNAPGSGDTSASDVASALSDTRAGNNDLDAKQSARDTISSDIGTLKTKFEAIDAVLLADALIHLKQTVDFIQTQNIVNRTIGGIDNATALLDSVPDVNAVLQQVNDIEAKLDTILDLDAMRDIIRDLNQTVTGGFDLSLVDDILSLTDNFGTIIDAAGSLIGEMRAISQYLVAIPSSIMDFTDTLNSTLITANSTVADMAQPVRDARTQILDLRNGSRFDFSGYLDTIDGFGSGIDFSTFTGSLNSSVSNLDSTRDSVDLTSIRGDVADMGSATSSASLTVSDSDIASVRSLGANFSAIVTALDTAKSIFDAWSTATRCTDTGVLCLKSDGGACSGTPANCQAGVRVCVDSSTSVPNAATIGTCPNTACSSGEICSLEGTTISAFEAVLNGYASNSGPDLSAVSAPITSLESTVAGLGSFATQRDQILTIQSSLEGIDVTSIRSTMTSSVDSMSPDSLGLSGLTGSMDGIRDMLNAVPIDMLQGTIGSATSQLDQVTTFKKMARSMDRGLLGFRCLFYEAMPPILGRLLRGPLERALADGGLSGLLEHVAGAAEDLMNVTGRAMPAASFMGGDDSSSAAADNATAPYCMGRLADEDPIFPIPAMNLTSMITPYSGALDALSSDENAAQGGFYFALVIAGEAMSGGEPATTVDGVDIIDTGFLKIVHRDSAAEGSTIFADSAGSEWPDGAMCITQACIDKTISGYTSSSIADVAPVPVPLSATLLLLVPYVIPILVVLLGLIPAVGFCGKQWHCCFTRWHMCCMCSVLPFIFIIAGALMFPLIMVMSDACRGGLNVGHQFVAGSSGWICNAAGGVTNTDGSCLIQVDAGAETASVRVDFGDVFTAVMGNCAANPTVFSNMYDGFRGVADAYATLYVNDTVIEGAESGGFPLRPPLQRVVSGISVNSSAAADGMITDLSDALGCSAISGLVVPMLDSFCCDIITPFYWSVSSWYLIAFAMCLCGYPATLLGEKRFPNQLWGKPYEEMTSSGLMRAREARQMEAQSRTGGPRTNIAPGDAAAEGEMTFDVQNPHHGGQPGAVALHPAPHGRGHGPVGVQGGTQPYNPSLMPRSAHAPHGKGLV